MQRTLLIANTILIILVLAVGLTLFMDTQLMRQTLTEHSQQLTDVQATDQSQVIKRLQTLEQSLEQIQERFTEIDTQTKRQISNLQSQIKTIQNKDVSSKDSQSNQLDRLIATEANDIELRAMIEQLNKQVQRIKVAMRGNQTALAIDDQAKIHRLPLHEPDADLKLSQITAKTLAGQWTLTMPNGYQRLARLNYAGPETLHLYTDEKLEATLKLVGNTLTSSTVTGENFIEYKWQILSPNRLRLFYTQSTEQENKYIGATMSRQ